jgi:hypothetical protein
VAAAAGGGGGGGGATRIEVSTGTGSACGHSIGITIRIPTASNCPATTHGTIHRLRVPRTGSRLCSNIVLTVEVFGE